MRCETALTLCPFGEWLRTGYARADGSVSRIAHRLAVPAGLHEDDDYENGIDAPAFNPNPMERVNLWWR